MSDRKHADLWRELVDEAGEALFSRDFEVGDVVPDGLKSRVAEQRFNVATHPCEIIVDTENRAILVEQAGA